MQAYTNNTNIPLIMAVMLATDDYDYNSDPNTISATSLLKSTRQLVLASRLPQTAKVLDVASQISNSIGSAIHNATEEAWINNYRTALHDLGVPKRVIDRIRINPTDEHLENNPDCMPFFLEQRNSRKLVVNGIEFTITGKYDFIADGMVQDIKTTGTYTYSNATKDEDYPMQGSIYRWLTPDKIIQETMKIIYVFTDWKAWKIKAEKNYPPKQIMGVDFPLISLQETEAFIHGKLSELLQFQTLPEAQLPLCTPKELWMSDPVWKYYKDPTKLKRATKNFENPQDAHALKTKNACGIVLEVRGEAKACHYCDAFPMCSQKDSLIASGDLVLKQ